MKEFLTFVTQHLMDNPDDFEVEEKKDIGEQRSYFLKFPPSEIGKIIGKQGHTIRAIRTLLTNAADRHGERVQLEVIERAEAKFSAG